MGVFRLFVRDVRVDTRRQQGEREREKESIGLRGRSMTRWRMASLTSPDGCIFNGTKIAAKTRGSAWSERREAP